ncbi:MAG: methyl-accepting chemotaxis protein [Deltaproteobacteria bacterium]|nr:methyl-accepting chemotaxis protein [Deltaproteobacteria bacterium]
MLHERAGGAGKGPLSFIDRVLPPELTEEPDDARRGRLLVIANVMLVAAALFFGWSTQPSGAAVSTTSLILVLAALMAAFNLPIAWALKSVRVPAALTAAELLGSTLMVGVIGGGVGDPSQWFLVVVPLLATFLVGPRWGFGFAAVAVAGTAAMFIAEQNGVPFSPPGPDDPWFHAFAASFVLVIGATFSSMYESARQDNLKLVGAALHELRAKNSELEALAAEVSSARDRAVEENKRKTEFLEQMRVLAEQQGLSLESTRKATAQLGETIRAISASAETLASASAASDATIASMAASAGGVTRTVGGLVEGVRETGKALAVLTSAVGSVQAQYDDLQGSARTTAAAMLEMEESASHVEENAARTVRLSDAMIKDAERGQDAVRRTLAGVDEIRASARVVGDVIRLLEQRVASIGAINNVIDEVAVETNVLALNASIIAAQAGEQGHGFAVVAGQIKALAARTAHSTREIASLIRALQAETRNAVGAIGDGDRAVETGVSLTDEAATALEKIVGSARQATEEVRGIEQATAMQAGRARDVGHAMGEVTRLLAAALKATHEHGSAVTLIDVAMKKLSALAPELADKSREQAEGGALARSAIAKISAMATRLNSVQADQSRASDETLRAIEELLKTQRGQEEALRRLSA